MKSTDRIVKLARIFQKKFAQQDPEATKMLNWIINDSPIQFGKQEAREVLDFLNKKARGEVSEGLVPDASKIDKIGAALVMYFYSIHGNNPGLHDHLKTNVNNLLDAFGEYKYLLNTTAEDLVSRWENAIKKIINAPKGSEQQFSSKYSYAPGLAEALLEVANKLKRR